MSRQSLIENYFKLRASPSIISTQKSDVKPTMNKVFRKRNLSLIKPSTPSKCPKISDENKNVSDVINLCSDDEDIWDNSPKKRSPCEDLTQRSNDSEESVTDCSMSTIEYSPGKTVQWPTTPQKNKYTSPRKNPPSPQKLEDKQVNNNLSTVATPIKTEPCNETPQGVEKLTEGHENNNNPSQITQQIPDTPMKTGSCNETPQKRAQGFQTPRKSPQSGSSVQSSQVSSHKSPRFFSPVRRRSVVKRPASGPKRSLEMSRSTASRILFEDELFANACEGMDDKTIFLLQIINKYLNTPSLKCLLDSKSQILLSNCLQVVKPGMRLICRLYWRKEGWYKKDEVARICSEDSETIDENSFQSMISSLVENRLLVQSNTQNITFDHFVSILKKDDLVDICKELKMNINSKQNAVEALRGFSKRTSNISNFLTGYTSSNSRRVLHMMSKKAGCCYKLSDEARSTLYNLYLLMYLGMDFSIIREKKLEYVLICDKIQRETYPLDKEMQLDDASVVFRTKDDFDRYLAAHHIYEDFLNCTDLNDKCNIVKQVYRLYQDITEEDMKRYTAVPQWLHRFTPPSIFIKVLESGIQDLKRVKQQQHYELALEVLDLMIAQTCFRQHKKAEWYAEKALILHTCLSRYDEAAKVLIEGFKSNLSDEAKDCMRPRANKIINQKNTTLSEALRTELMCVELDTREEAILEKNFKGKHIEKQPMERSVGKRGKVQFETRSAAGRVVQDAEEYCIVHYKHTEDLNGEHWEGRIVNSLFFLLFWDIIYTRPSDARGVFLSHYQLHPLDLYTDAFYTNRKQAIDARLEVIEGASEHTLLGIMHDTWSQRPEHELSGFSRGAISWEQLKSVACCLGGARLAHICRRLATNYCYAHSGFPDLTLWNHHTKQIKFVEVKTDTDKPSMKQLQWMQYLRAHDIDTEFCYVGVHTTRQRCRVHTEHNTKPKVKKERKKTVKRKNETRVKTEPVQENEPERTEPVVENETRVKTEPVQENEPERTEPVVENETRVKTEPAVENEPESSPDCIMFENELQVKTEPEAKTESKIRAQLLFES